MSTSIHPTAIVDEGAKIGEYSRIWHWILCAGVKIGKGCSLGQNVFVGNDVVLGNNVKIQNNISIYDAVHLEDDVFCGPSMLFTNVYNPRAAIIRKNEYRPTIVRRGANLGANCTIICGVQIGEHAFIGAAAVVNRDVMPYELMEGVPAKHRGWMCSCGVQLKGKVTVHCKCDTRYQISDEACHLIAIQHEKSFI
jgi:UDP-2-acetamido-3-amino-2,3-dideoxy-glucuronate N-acetyltransferase